MSRMSSYARYARSDAMDIAQLLDDHIGASRAHSIFERVQQDSLEQFEVEMSEAIADFLARTLSQRPAALRKLPDETSKVCFLVLAIQGAMRAHDVLELRDSYESALTPGRSNRTTISAIYGFATAVQATFDYSWPWEVFSDMGIYTGPPDEEDEETSSPLPDAIHPTAPPPKPEPEPIVEPANQAIYVSIGYSKVVRASETSDQPAWQLQVVNEQDGYAHVWIASEPLEQNVSLIPLLLAVVNVKAAKPFLLHLPRDHAALVEALNQSAERTVATIARATVASRPCMSWANEHFAGLKRELELVNESLPDAPTLRKAYSLYTGNDRRLIPVHGWDVQNDWAKQRNSWEDWTRAILMLRGRWTGDLAQEKYASSVADPRSVGKIRRALEKLATVERRYREDLAYAVGPQLLQWVEGQASTQEAAALAGATYLRMLRPETNSWASRQSAGEDIGDLMGDGSQELSLLDAGLVRQMQGPFEVAWHLASGVTHAGFTSRTASFLGVWWCELEGSEASFVDHKWLLTAKQLASAGYDAIARHCGEVALRVDPQLQFLSQSRPRLRRWSDESFSDVRYQAQYLADWVASPDTCKFQKHQRPIGDHPRRGFLVVVRGATAETVQRAREAWDVHAAAAIEERLRRVDGRRTREVPADIKVLPKSVDFLEPVITRSEHLSLMAGRTWDASNI